MRLPILPEISLSRDFIETFGGYNHNERIGENEFYDMKNLTSDKYPLLSPRSKRGTYAEPENPQGLIAKDALCYIDGTKFVINDNHIDLELSVRDEDCPKQLISMGAYVIILPDKKYINTANLNDYGNIEASFNSQGTVSFEMCDINGNAYDNVITSSSAPVDPTNNTLWLDNSATPNTLKQFSETSGIWVSIATTYIKISAPQIGKPFENGDGVKISGVEDERLADLNNTMVIWKCEEDYIVVIGIISGKLTQDLPIQIERTMPQMDFIIENNNRLWGCKYGVSNEGEFVNELYACKLGDFKNWNCFVGVSTDSYRVSLGTDGQFTGAITHKGYPVFFKENCLHKVYGNYPSNFGVQTTACSGVQKGSSKSLAIVNELLYYKSRTGICVYDGALPSEISSVLGNELYSNAIAVAHRNKYYISMLNKNNEFDMFVFDTVKGLWHKEDNTEIYAWCSVDDELFFIDGKDRKIKSIYGTGEPTEDDINWLAETGIIGASTPNKKYLSQLMVRIALEIGSRVSFYVQYDSCGDWIHLSTLTGNSLKTFNASVRPQRCDHLKLRILGKGDAKIYSISKVFEQGSVY